MTAVYLFQIFSSKLTYEYLQWQSEWAFDFLGDCGDKGLYYCKCILVLWSGICWCLGDGGEVLSGNTSTMVMCGHERLKVGKKTVNSV